VSDRYYAIAKWRDSYGRLWTCAVHSVTSIAQAELHAESIDRAPGVQAKSVIEHWPKGDRSRAHPLTAGCPDGPYCQGYCQNFQPSDR
jgi:hypothetical protein